MKNKQYPWYHEVDLFTLKEFLKYCTEKYSDDMAFLLRLKKIFVTKHIVILIKTLSC